MTTTYAINGMTCGHCVSAVTTEIRTIPGVREVHVDLVAGGTSTAHVTSDTPLHDDTVRAAVDEAGYTLAG
jgi:copper chaperone CopZ